jgi:hypothetical protein
MQNAAKARRCSLPTLRKVSCARAAKPALAGRTRR